MKKLILSLTGVIAILFSLTFCSLTVSANDDLSMFDEGNSCRIYYQLDYYYETATITDLNSWSYSAAIPEYIYAYDEYDNFKQFTVNSIRGFIDSYDIDDISIPSSVTYIEPHSIGYSYDEEDGMYYPIDSFTIYCVDGSAAERYAEENGFEVVLVRDISDLNITLSETDFTYDGYDKIPGVTITDGAKTLVEGEDYSLEYVNNYNAGTATVIIRSIVGDYCGMAEKAFTINPVPASMITVSPVGDYEYGGYEIKPSFDVRYGDRWLDSWYDYSVSYRNNYYPGTAYADITFRGNYTGTLTVSFNIRVSAVDSFYAEADSASRIYLGWDTWSSNADYYYIYRLDKSTGKYVYLDKTRYSGFSDKGLSQCETYKYQIIPVVIDDNNVAIKGEPAYTECTTKLASPAFELTVLKKSIKIEYKKNSKADGYIIYRQRWDKYGEPKAIKTISGNASGTYKDTGIKQNGTYAYTIVSYKMVNGKPVYGETGSEHSTTDADAILRGATLKSRKSFKVYNKQGKSTSSYTYTLSDNDIKILKQFAKKHFKKNMTEAEKLRYTLNWLNKNVKYAVGNDWSKISGKSWVEASFKKKLGQCAQYNGAMAAMMAYLGYDACVIQSYRGYYPSNIWQHFWCEVKIQGRKYLMETGNYGKNGPWSYFLAPYQYTDKYVINQKPAEVAETEPEVASVKLSKTKYTYNGKAKKPAVTAKDTHGNTLKEGKDYTVTYSGKRKNVGNYTVTVKFKGKYSGKKKLTFKIVPKTTTVSKLKASSGKLTVKWKKQKTQTSGYQIEYSTSSKLKKSKKVTIKKNSSISKTIKNLKKGKKYYVRVRTYKTVDGKKIYSNWSKVKNVKMK